MLALLLAITVAVPDTIEMSLADALRVALKQSPVRTEISVSQAQGASRLARGITNLLPGVSASVGYAKSDGGSGLLPESLQTGSDWSWTGNLTVNQVVFDPAVFVGLASSVVYSGYYATEARKKQARLIYDVTTDYLNLLKTRLLLDAARASLRRAEENLRVIEEKHLLGAASRIDFMRSEVFRSQAEIELLRAEKSLAVAAEAFKATVNLGDNVLVRPTEKLTEPSGFPISDPDSLLAEIRRRNPGIALAAKTQTAARMGVASAIGRALPSVSAYWSSSFSDSAFPSSYGRWCENDAISYGIRASFPLLDLKSYVLDIVDATTESHRARAAATSAALAIRTTGTSAILEYQEAKQTWDYAQRNLRLNQELSELAREQHRLGAISPADLFNVEADLAQARATHVSALCDTYIQAARINYLLGVTEPGAESKP